jgi:ABC-type transport system involved in multi-copper enzyme maturation permease subunit
LIRIGYLGALIVLVVMGLLTGSGMAEASMTDLAKSGTAVFERVAYGQVILICLLAPLFMAGAIHAERSGQTYEILLSTPLSNMQIVLGTLMGRLFFILAILASGIPLFAVLLIFGGVPIASVFMSFAVAALTALTVGAVAVTLSSMRTGGRKAVFVFVIGVAGYLVASYVVDNLILRRFAATPNTTTWLTPLHPILVLEASLNRANYHPPPPEALTGYGAPLRLYLGRPFAAFAALSGLLSFGLITFCAVRLRSVGQGPSPWRIRMRKLLRLGVASEGERRRAPRVVSKNPIAWRESNTRGRSIGAVVGRGAFLVVALALGGVLLLLYHQSNLPQLRDVMGVPLPQHVVFHNALLSLLMLELAVIVMIAIYMSAGSISREREDGTLDLLLTTPITPKMYIWGKLRGLVSFLTVLLAAPVLTLAMVSAYTVIGKMNQWPQAEVSYAFDTLTAQGDLLLPEAPILLALLLVPFVAVCVMTGMSWSIKSSSVLASVVSTVGVIGCLTLVMGFCGWNMAREAEFIGPLINAFSPSTNFVMILNPWEHVGGFLRDPNMHRPVLLFAALIGAGGYSLVVYAVLIGIVKNFDQTVRKLTGTG